MALFKKVKQLHRNNLKNLFQIFLRFKNNIPHGDGQSSEELKVARQIKVDIIESLRNKDSKVIKDMEDLIGDSRSLNYDLDKFYNIYK